MKRLLVSGLIVVLGGCAYHGPTNVEFSAEEAAFIRKEGKGTIVGHAFRPRLRGQVVNAAGEVVRLIPATAYARARFRDLYGTRKFLPGLTYAQVTADAGYVEYARTTKTESNGRFAFDKVAPGSYFVTTVVRWREKDQWLLDGGYVYDEVTLTGKETEPVQVVLSGN